MTYLPLFNLIILQIFTEYLLWARHYWVQEEYKDYLFRIVFLQKVYHILGELRHILKDIIKCRKRYKISIEADNTSKKSNS